MDKHRQDEINRNDQPGRTGAEQDDTSFGSSGQQATAAANNKMHYSHNADTADAVPQSGGTSGAVSGGPDETMMPTSAGRGFSATTDAEYSGPGTATDRGYGVIADDFGTGVDAGGLGSGEGLDQRDLGNADAATNSGSVGSVGLSRKAGERNMSDTTAGDTGLAGGGIQGQSVTGSDLSDTGSSSTPER